MSTVGSMYSGGRTEDEEARSMSIVGSTDVASGMFGRPLGVDRSVPGAGVCP
jgi:hypothetical protein